MNATVSKVVGKVKADQSKLARYSRAFLAWLAALLLQVTAVGAEVVETWTLKRWLLTLGIAALPGIVGLIGVGQKNPVAPPAA